MGLRGIAFGVLLSMSGTALAADKKAPPPRPTEEPNWMEVRKGAEELLTRDLYDPQAAQLTWRGGWRWGHVKPVSFGLSVNMAG